VQVTGSVWLVTSAAGYVGSHVVRALCARGAQVVGLDDLSRGDPARLPPDVPLVVGSVHDSDLVALTLRHHHVDGVIHLAARKAVTESRERPLLYYNENVNGLVRLLEAMETASVTRLLFCSSAAVYGTPRVERVDEQAACAPLSPYGETKLAGEWLIRNQAAAVGLRYVVLRCFNVAGAASPKLVDRGATNVIPLVLRALAGGQAPQVFGADYATPDSTCVRELRPRGRCCRGSRRFACIAKSCPRQRRGAQRRLWTGPVRAGGSRLQPRDHRHRHGAPHPVAAARRPLKDRGLPGSDHPPNRLETVVQPARHDRLMLGRPLQIR